MASRVIASVAVTQPGTQKPPFDRKPTLRRRAWRLPSEPSRKSGMFSLYIAPNSSAIIRQAPAGALTFDEALTQLLSGTGLTYRYSTRARSPSSDSLQLLFQSRRVSGKLPSRLRERVGGEDFQGEGKAKSFWDRLRLAQVDQGASSKSSSSEGGDKNYSDTSSESATKLEEVVVTGTHINRSDFESRRPLRRVRKRAESGRRHDVGGSARQDDSVSPGSNAKASNSRSRAGASRFDLRGLGTTRTLTLVDGHRYAPSILREIDTNMIPSGIVERSTWRPEALGGLWIRCDRRGGQHRAEERLRRLEDRCRAVNRPITTIRMESHVEFRHPFCRRSRSIIVATEATDSDASTERRARLGRGPVGARIEGTGWR